MPRCIHRGGCFAGAAARLTAQFAEKLQTTLAISPPCGIPMPAAI
jgi:hypothetical protein